MILRLFSLRMTHLSFVYSSLTAVVVSVYFNILR